MASQLDFDLCRFDIEQAFVQSDLEENICMHSPQGCGRMSGKITRLNKSLYGLKQASRPWHAHLTRCLLRLGFVQCLADACVVRLMEVGRVVMTIVVHVDNTFAVGRSQGVTSQGFESNGPGQKSGRVALVPGVFLREKLGEGGVEDFPADIR